MKHSTALVLALPPILICAAAAILYHKPVQTTIPAGTEAERTAWLRSQGWDAQPYSVQDVTIPQMTGVYADYAALQTYQHLPLQDYAGQRGVLYTYILKDTQLRAELLTVDGALVGAQCYVPEDSATLDMQGKPLRGS